MGEGPPQLVSAKHYNFFKACRDGQRPQPDPDLTLESVIFKVLEFEHIRPDPPQETP